LTFILLLVICTMLKRAELVKFQRYILHPSSG
jgi:hypothetical protein